MHTTMQMGQPLPALCPLDLFLPTTLVMFLTIPLS
jgi:hypothetical protein